MSKLQQKLFARHKALQEAFWNTLQTLRELMEHLQINADVIGQHERRQKWQHTK